MLEVGTDTKRDNYSGVLPVSGGDLSMSFVLHAGKIGFCCPPLTKFSAKPRFLLPFVSGVTSDAPRLACDAPWRACGLCLSELLTAR